MASALYDKGRKAFADGGINLPTDTIKAVLVSSAYTPNLATHQFLSDLGANTIGTAQPLTFTSDTAGTYKASNPTFSGLSGSFTASYIALFKDTGVAGTSPLIGLYDGKAKVTAAAAASTSATSVAVDPLTAAIASGAVLAFTGGTSATLTAPAAVGARSLTVSALAGGIAVNETTQAPVAGANLPVVSSGAVASIAVTFDATNGLFTL